MLEVAETHSALYILMKAQGGAQSQGRMVPSPSSSDVECYARLWAVAAKIRAQTYIEGYTSRHNIRRWRGARC